MKEIEIDFTKIFKGIGAWFSNYVPLIILIAVFLGAVSAVAVVSMFAIPTKDGKPITEHAGVDIVVPEVVQVLESKYPFDALVELIEALHKSENYMFTKFYVSYFPDSSRWYGEITFKHNGKTVEMELRPKDESWEAFQKELDKTKRLIDIMKE